MGHSRRRPGRTPECIDDALPFVDRPSPNPRMQGLRSGKDEDTEETAYRSKLNHGPVRRLLRQPNEISPGRLDWQMYYALSSNSPLISTGMPCGSSAMPTAVRACWPNFGPNSS